MKPAFRNFVIAVFLFYMTGAAIFLPYFNWIYAKEHGFMKWLLFGEVIATGKAVVWPYFIFTSPQKGTAHHVSMAIQYRNNATGLLSKLSEGGSPYLSKTDTDDMMYNFKRALEEARQADIEVMNRAYPQYGNYFKDKFIRGIDLFIQGIDAGDAELSLAGQIMMNDFGDWYVANVEKDRGNADD